jgi:hypothetical protein
MENSAIEKAKKYASRILNLASYVKGEKNRPEVASFLVEAGLNMGAYLSLAFEDEFNDDIFETFQHALTWGVKSRFYLQTLLQNNVLTQKEFDSISHDCEELISIIKELLRSIQEGV